METKTCTKCGFTKSIEEFVKRRTAPDGHTSHCKLCHSLYHQPTSEAGKRRRRIKQETAALLPLPGMFVCEHCGKTWPEEEYDHYKNGKRYAFCKECRREYARNWKSRNRQHISEYNRQYREKNGEYIRSLWDAWIAKNRTMHLWKKRAASKTDKVRLYFRNKQAERRTLEKNGDVTDAYLIALFEAQPHCAYCGQPFHSRRKPTLDHIVPISKGGTHTKDNLTLACGSCNSTKGNRDISPTFCTEEAAALVITCISASE